MMQRTTRMQLTRIVLAASLFLVVASVGILAKRYRDRLEMERIVNVVLEKASEREKVATTLAEQNKVGEAVSLLVPELFEGLTRHADFREVASIRESLEKKRHEWELLIKLRKVTIEEQEKRINSFVLGEFAPFDLEVDESAALSTGIVERNVERGALDTLPARGPGQRRRNRGRNSRGGDPGSGRNRRVCRARR